MVIVDFNNFFLSKVQFFRLMFDSHLDFSEDC